MSPRHRVLPAAAVRAILLLLLLLIDPTRAALCPCMGCRSNYWRTCQQPAVTLQLMAGSRKKPVQLPVVQLLERVGKVSWQHVSRRQFFGAAHDRTGLLGGCQACRGVSAKR